MITLTNKYEGKLRTIANHLQSGDSITTDAPTDNNGKGEAFSPTDLVACALSSCMLTTMGILAERENINIAGIHTEVVKIMASDPRRVSEVHIEMYWNDIQANESEIDALKNAALTCPVALSIHPDIKQKINFHF